MHQSMSTIRIGNMEQLEITGPVNVHITIQFTSSSNVQQRPSTVEESSTSNRKRIRPTVIKSADVKNEKKIRVASAADSDPAIDLSQSGKDPVENLVKTKKNTRLREKKTVSMK